MLADEEDGALRLELVRSLEAYKEEYKRNTIDITHHIPAHYTPDKLSKKQEVELINWLITPRETRLQFQNLGSLLDIRGLINLVHLKVLIFNILWALPKSPLSRQLHSLYCPAIHQPKKLKYL